MSVFNNSSIIPETNTKSSANRASSVNNSELKKIPETLDSKPQLSVPVKAGQVSKNAVKTINNGQDNRTSNKKLNIQKVDRNAPTIQGTDTAYRKTSKGEVISKKYTDVDGAEIGEEILIRAKTIEILRGQLRSELKYLKALPANPDIIERIITLEYKLGLVNTFKSEWASTDSQRMLFDKLKEFAKQIGVPVLTNLRTDEVRIAGEKFCINRSSAITDFSHAEISLQEIRDYQELEALSSGKWQNYQNLSEEKISYYKTFYNTDITDKKAFSRLLLNLKNRIDSSYGFKSNNDEIKKVVNERTDVLKTQFLQDLLVHFQNEPADSANVLHTRVALLDPTKEPQINKKTGYQNNERTEFLDMKAIYEKLDKATIVFDLEDGNDGPCGPFIDPEGKIHMPKACSTNGVKEANLCAVIFNAAVPYNKTNAPMQLALNNKSLERLKLQNLTKAQQDQLEEIGKDLKTYSKHSFKQAHNLIKFSRNLEGYSSVDCHGGKDRTGYAVALETYYALREKMRAKKAQKPEFTERKYRKSVSKTKKELIDSKSVTAQAAQDNTGHTVLKISDFRLKLYVSGKGKELLSGIGRRLSDYLRAAAIFLPELLVTQPSRHDETILFDQDKEIQEIIAYMNAHPIASKELKSRIHPL